MNKIWKYIKAFFGGFDHMFQGMCRPRKNWIGYDYYRKCQLERNIPKLKLKLQRMKDEYKLLKDVKNPNE